MLGRIFGVCALIAVIFGAVSGQVSALGDAVLDGVSRAVTLTVSLGGMMCFWSGLMAVLKEAGAIRALSRLLRPLIRIFFPDAARTGEGAEEIAANIAANLLGLGNAATPMGLAAMRKLSDAAVRLGEPSDTATGDMITLAVLNTASVSLVPSTVILLRQRAGADDPFAVVSAVWIVSLCSALLALTLTRVCRGIPVRRKSVVSGDRPDNTGDSP